MKETAEQVTPTHPALMIFADDGHPNASIRSLEPQRPVRTGLVVMLDVDLQDLLQTPTPDDQEPSQGSQRGPFGSTVPHTQP